MELKNKYFHSVHSYKFDSWHEERIRSEELKDILMKFEMIFKCGYILPYKDIVDLYDSVSINKNVRLNKDNMVSVSLHKDNPEEMDVYIKRSLMMLLKMLLKISFFKNHLLF